MSCMEVAEVLNVSFVQHLQDPEDDRGIMEGLQGAAAAVQAAEFARAHERLLDQPGCTPVEVLQELKQAAKVAAAELVLIVSMCPRQANAAEPEGAEGTTIRRPTLYDGC